MRCLSKLPIPQVLADNEAQWLDEYIADPESNTKKYRYRHKDIKDQLKIETASKCIYCESKIGHNAPGDIEHKIPSSKDPTRHFSWANLTLACPECNRRKNDYYSQRDEFLDPYVDDVEAMLEHHGPVVLWRAGNTRAEISVKTLELNSASRTDLFRQKIQKCNYLAEVVERYLDATNMVHKALLRKQLETMASKTEEYSAMVLSILRGKGVI